VNSPTKPDGQRLFEIIEGQQGYFTSAQAVDAGFSRSTHTYHVGAGTWVREHRGLYRLRQYPLSAEGQLVLWSLWSQDRQGKAQGVYSHLTALSIKELSDANPARLDMSVPPAFRRNSEIPAVLKLHKAKLEPDEITHARGYAITTPMRAILDLAFSQEIDRGLIIQAFEEGRKRGLITKRQINDACMRPGLPAWLLAMFKRAKK
jgi:predicted transcriptional regulator of viral defense system